MNEETRAHENAKRQKMRQTCDGGEAARVSLVLIKSNASWCSHKLNTSHRACSEAYAIEVTKALCNLVAKGQFGFVAHAIQVIGVVDLGIRAGASVLV